MCIDKFMSKSYNNNLWFLFDSFFVLVPISFITTSWISSPQKFNVRDDDDGDGGNNNNRLKTGEWNE